MPTPVSIHGKGLIERVSQHFTSREFDCPCEKCNYTAIDPRLVQLLDAMREKLGQPIAIHSGFRCADHQAELKERGYETATGISTHTLGQAADIASQGHSGVDLAMIAREVGFEAVGIAPTWIHADLRTGKRRGWLYVRR